MKRILLTGANGFIGKNFIENFGLDYEIVKVTRESKYDILDLNSLLQINDIDVVIHAAAKTFVPDSFDNPYSFYDFNISSTLNIAEFCRVKKIQKVIYLNSYSYGVPKYLPIDENHRVSFHSPYNKSKYIAEEILFNYLQAVSDVISLRLFNIFGKYQGDNFLIPTIINQALKESSIKVNDLKPKRDYLYIKDLMTLIDKVINTDNINGIYNVGSAKSYSVEEVINSINSIIDKKIDIVSNNIRRENEVMDCYSNIDKLSKDLKWKPEYSLVNGLYDYIQEIKNV